MASKITVIVLNYKNLKDTTGCIKAIQSSDGGKLCRFIVVDNSLEKENKPQLKKSLPFVQYLPSPGNIGFAGGNNQGIKQALKDKSDYILIVNPDVRVGHNFFKPLLKHFSGKNVGIVAPVTVHTQKDKKVYGLEGHINWSLAKPSHRDVSILNEEKPIVSEFVTFACVLISAETFKKAGFIDERYFMYFEDVDYCLTARKAGVKIILDPSVVVSHQTSSSFSKPTKKLWISFRSHLKFIFKWLSPDKIFMPLIYALTSYPYLYLLWTYHGLKYKTDD